MRRLVLLAGALALPAPAFARAPLPFVLKEVGPGVYAAIDGPDHKAGSNAGFVIGDACFGKTSGKCDDSHGAG